MNYNSGNYDKYMSKNPLKKHMVNNLNKNILKLIKELRGEGKLKLLDAGCGEGFISDLLYHEVDNIEITGLEFTEEALEIAKSMNNGVHFMQGDIYNMPFADKYFDVVLCTEVLEHLENPDAALKEISRVARNAVLLTVPNEPWFCMGNLLVLKNVRRLGNPIDHINHWTYIKFVNYIKKTLGDTCISLGSFPWTIVLWKR